MIDNSALSDALRYTTVTVDTARVLESWRLSLLSYEWLRADGTIKSLEELPAHEQPKRQAVEAKLVRGEALEKPMLGIGILDNVEIGLGRDVFLTLAAQGAKTLPVHIGTGNRDDFAPFMVTAG